MINIKCGDIVIFPGILKQEAYFVSKVENETFSVSVYVDGGPNYVSFDFEELDEWIKRGSHFLITDEKEKLEYILKNSDKIYKA